MINNAVNKTTNKSFERLVPLNKFVNLAILQHQCHHLKTYHIYGIQHQ